MPSSKPSRRIVSMSTPSCNSPRPATSKLSLSAASVTLIATLDSASRIRRSRIMRLVTLLPSRPAIGESFTAKSIDSVRSEEHTSEIQSLMRISYAVFFLKKKKYNEHYSLLCKKYQIQKQQFKT